MACYVNICKNKEKTTNNVNPAISYQTFSDNKLGSSMEWNPEDIFKYSQSNYAILVLNREIACPANVVKDLWENAKIRITVDGGTNRWLSFIQKHFPNTKLMKPDIISGDFDSVTKDALTYFKESKIIETPDQNDTDFTKALKLLHPITKEKKIKFVTVLCECSGRLDQIMANLNTLCKANVIIPNIKIYLLNGTSLTWLLEPNLNSSKHSIKIPKYLLDEKRWCSMIPISGKSCVKTKGLKWNLDNQTTEFGKIVSTSNTYESEIVEIITSGYLLWSMGMFNFTDEL